ncbi:DUF2786 domain-containing protein [Streptomyces acidiscabies]|uniref:DUF2786 domain-containing protein n=1 Tax=Streptomyces acidiscabies TaxID=42234 RepID=UPI0015C1C0D8|nr:DUF2786 domain-containing protein [Streptomyces acidiscabies]
MNDGPMAEEFREARFDWLRERERDLAAVLKTDGTDLYKLLPDDELGDRHTTAASVVAMIAADVARAQPPGETVARLERLIPGGHRHDLATVVEEIRSCIPSGGESALWSWNAEGWEELLLGFMELPGGGLGEPERAPRRHGRTLVSLTDSFAHEAEPLRLLSQAVLREPRTAAAIEDAVLLREEYLQGAGHLRWLAEQQASVEELEAWRREQQKAGSEATRAFLAELSETAKRYVSLVLQPVVDALSAGERALLADSRAGARRTAADYLEAFLNWYDQPEDDTPDQRHAQGETTWWGMAGTTPVWYHVVTSPQERAAALAYSGRPSASVVRVRTGEDEPDSSPGLWDDLWDRPDEDADWYPEPGITVHYEPDDVAGLCVLLAVAQLGHARLEFLTARPDGTVVPLRAVQAQVRTDDADAWRRWALAKLSVLAPDPEDLADALAGTDDDQPEPDTDSGTAAPGPRGALSPELLSKVKALLRKAENPAATAEESRAYQDKAMQLMAKYGIEQAVLDDAGESAKPADKMIDIHPPYAKEVRRLFSRIAQEMRCQTVLIDIRGKGRRLHVFGYESDIQAAELLFASLRLQMLDGADLADRRHRPEGEDARAYKRSWMLGFVREVTERIGVAQRAATDAADHEGPDDGTHTAGRSVALVLADRSTLVKTQLDQRYPNLRQARTTKIKGTGYWRGVADGRLADIGGGTAVDAEAASGELAS